MTIIERKALQIGLEVYSWERATAASPGKNMQAEVGMGTPGENLNPGPQTSQMRQGRSI